MQFSDILETALGKSFTLTPDELEAIRQLPNRTVSLVANESIHRAGDKPSCCFVILDGIVSSSVLIEDDKRQIMSLYVRGDMPDLRTLHLKVMDSDLRTMSACRLAFIDHVDIEALSAAHPRITAALWRATLVVASIYRQWIVNNGHRSAVARLAHLFCEMLTRLEIAGLAENGSCYLPLTQVHLSQATGLSSVHVNRSLQQMRKSGLLIFHNGRLAILDWPALTRIANFQPDYLHPPGD